MDNSQMQIDTVESITVLTERLTVNLDRLPLPLLIARLDNAAGFFIESGTELMKLRGLSQSAANVDEILPAGKGIACFIAELLTTQSRYFPVYLGGTYSASTLANTINHLLHDKVWGMVEHYPRMAQRCNIVHSDGSWMEDLDLMVLYETFIALLWPEVILSISKTEDDANSLRSHMQSQDYMAPYLFETAA